MLGGVCVGRIDRLVEAVGQDDAGLAAGQRGGDAFGVLGAWHAAVQALLGLGGDLLAVGDQDGAGELVVLGLADQVGGQVFGVRAGVGDEAVATKMLPGPVILSTGSHSTSPSCGSVPLAP